MRHLELNHPTVVAEVIDGEAIIMNFDTGTYYSLIGIGAMIWEMIENGVGQEEIAPLLMSIYYGTNEEIERGVNAFINYLVGENILRPKEQANSSHAYTAPVPTTKTRFEAPILNKYTDLQDLLLVDPIHDVDEQGGWPNVSS